MIEFMKLFPFRLGHINKNNLKELFKDAAPILIVFWSAFFAGFYNYVEVKEILNHKFN